MNSRWSVTDIRHWRDGPVLAARAGGVIGRGVEGLYRTGSSRSDAGRARITTPREGVAERTIWGRSAPEVSPCLIGDRYSFDYANRAPNDVA